MQLSPSNHSTSSTEDAADLKVETSPDDNKPLDSPSNVATASESSPKHGNSSPTAQSEDSTVTSPHPAQTEGTYSTDLFRAFPKVCQKAKSGVQLCQAVSAFVVERAGLESNYAQALLKLAQSAKAEDWSEQFTECWAAFQEATEHLAQERWAFAQTMQTSIVPGAKAFAAQQETQVHRLVSEGTKVRWAQQQMISSMDKAKEKYERKCQEAIEITATMRKSESGTSADVNSSSSDSSDEVSTSKELTDKLAAGAGQLLTKMWDTTSAFGRSPLERQRSKLYSSLEDVIAAEKHYVQTVEYTNAQRLIFEREIKENLHAFQLTEEQRLEYLRDVLMRMQKAFIGMFSRSQQFVERMKASANKVDELVDIEKGFQSLGSQEEVDVDRADLSVNPFYLRMTHIQAMSDNGQRMVGTINTVVTEFIASETRFSHSLRKLLRMHENGGLALPTDLFGTSSSMNFLSDEGTTMANGWMTVKDQVKLLLEVHQEFRSLLAEPVSLSLATMKSEYENVRVSTQEGFSKLHASLCNEAAAHKKLHHKLDTKARDFAMTFSYLPGATPVATSSYGLDVTQALMVLSANHSNLPVHAYYSDECYQSIQQLRSIKKETEELMSDPAKQPDTESLDTDNKPATDSESRRRRSSMDLAAVAPSPESTSPDTTPAEDSRPPSSLSSDSVASPPTIPDKDTLLSEYDLLLDEEVEFSVETAFSTLWVESDTFSRNVLEAAGATNISLPAWEKKATSYTAVTTPDTFDGSRVVSYTHNKKYMVGPSVIPTTQTQRYSYTPGSRLVVSTTTCVSDVPYCDYFRVEHRWVFSATKKRGVCLAQVGLRVQWSKSTWLKKQVCTIESTTVTEAKDAIKAWFNAALDATKEKASTGSSAGSPAPATKHSEKQSESVACSAQEVPSKEPTKEVAAATSSPLQADSTSTYGLPAQLHPAIQVAIIICALMFVFTMYRVCTAMNQMQELTRESLIQQRQQQELLKELLERLGSTRER
ncbi:hypothetical protein JG687_00002137 [Phytophthora cactorum]|uniref:VASt domain-containing protein n=1 Tax=Phytophthora cactorum TaxID=29920 RepID=A0A8T1UW23_9STRA|nr:hypothetical protein JG687_00002137 [Phytophthora cactorum]